MTLTREQTIEILERPFDEHELEQKDVGRGRSFTYVKTHSVIERLNQATGYNWSEKIVSETWTTIPARRKADNGEYAEFEQRVHIVAIELSIPGLGTRVGYGTQEIETNAGADVIAKGAASDALKKAASHFGVGLYLPQGSASQSRPTASSQEYRRGLPENQQNRSFQTRPNNTATGKTCTACRRPMSAAMAQYSEREIPGSCLCVSCRERRHAEAA